MSKSPVRHEDGTPRTRGRVGKEKEMQDMGKPEEKRRRKGSPAKTAVNEGGTGRRTRSSTLPEASTSTASILLVGQVPTPTRPNHRKRKSEHVVPSVEELSMGADQSTALQSTRKKQRKSVELDVKGKGKEREASPKRVRFSVFLAFCGVD